MKIIATKCKSNGGRGIVKRQVVIPNTSVNEYDKLQRFIQALANVPNGLSKNERQAQQQDTAKVVKICWYTVYIRTGETVSDSSIMLTIGWILRPLVVRPYNFERVGTECQFYLDDLLVAKRLMRLEHAFAEQYISEPLDVRVVIGLPSVEMNPKITMELVNGIRSALKANYDPNTQCLDLTQFHSKMTVFCPLHVEKLLKCVLQVISQEVPMVKKIVLKNNNLCSLLAFRCISWPYPQLETLDISFNNIKIFDDLPFLNTLKVNTLILSGNGIGQHTCLEEMKKISPNTTLICNTLQLDHGMDKQPVDIIKSPTSFLLPKIDHNSNAMAIDFFLRFHQTYYPHFDKCEDRSGLGIYYSPMAMFSLSVSDNLLDVDAYNHYNRNQCSNQLSLFDPLRKLQIGGSAIVKALNRIPEIQSQHKDSTISVLMYTDNMRAFVLTGSFLESTKNGWTKRQFQRTFILTLSEVGNWLISNDMLCITEPPKMETIKIEELSIGTNDPHKSEKDTTSDLLNENMKQLMLTNPEDCSIAGQSSLRSNMISPIPSFTDLIGDDNDSIDLEVDINENIFESEEESL